MSFGSIVQRRTPTLFAGRLRHKIDLVIEVPSQDSTGGVDITDNVVFANVWASVEALNGNETQAAGQELSAVTHQIVIRYIGPAPSWQPTYLYPGGSFVKDSNGNLQRAWGGGPAKGGGGTSGSVAPAWNTTAGGITTDGVQPGLVWQNLGVAPERTGVTSDMMVWFQGRQFEVEAVLNPDERNKMLILLCIEINQSVQQRVKIPTGLQ